MRWIQNFACKGIKFVLLQVDNLQTYFGSRDAPLRAVDGVSFQIDRGQTLALVGESGSGKSVTALSILRLIQGPAGFHPGGRILLDRESTPTDLMSLGEAAMRSIRGRRISMIFQEPMTSLNPVLSVGYQIAEPLQRHMGLSRAEARTRSIEAIEAVHIPNPAQRFTEYPHQLSGGMRQRVMIAMAMACEPDLLIADEPTTALDVTIQAQILKLMKELQERRGTAILFITHDLGVVNQVADEVAVMQNGHIVERGDKSAILRAPQHAYTQSLLAALPSNLSRPAPPPPAPADATPLLQIQNLQVHFPIRRGILKRTVGHVKAVDGVDLSLAPGSITALVGESGCGKTTLGKAALRLIEPTSGQIRFKGTDLMTLDAGQMRAQRRNVQFIFQDPFSSLNPRMMIGEAIAEGLDAQGIGDNYDDRRERAKVALTTAQLDANVIDRYPHECSGGQRQRVGIARCLALDPKFIVCDEITSALDVSVQATILQLLQDLRKRLGLTLLFITHDMEVVEYLADEVAVMRDGKIVEHGLTEQVCGDPQHDYTKTLLSAVPRL
jgi:peptide/nickel transport system ATP-binding protein